MTQDVEPLTWQKRTNLEEHQQFFSKINEIIANLAPTVDEAEAAIAQATQALADANAAITNANTAIATANAASAAADAAVQQAQTAATTVAGYNTRLTAAEGDIDALQGRMGTAEGKITAVEGREADYLKKTGAAQTVTSQIMVPTTATGVRDTQIANGTRIQNDLDNYQPMMRLANAQTYTGTKELLKTASILPSMIRVTDAAAADYPDMIYLSGIRDAENNWLVNDRIGTDNNGARGYYQKQYRLHTNTGNYTVNVRLNLTSTDVQIQILDPINNQWRTVQLS